ncbi:hypothetical protein CAEBREN_22843 [Caenorhabditis brenneri]|uniref:Uncharacterized protein n=1 Tax=Caenorhabditis brenneri TaxID=135651 RepID=G0NE64_CAEBE|nr:hypothetical protein CAEBREN_22843 [Caenorhabditis brenneri]
MTTIIRVFFVLLLFGIIAIFHLQLVQNVGIKLRSIDNSAEVQNHRLHPECTCVYNEKTYNFCYTDPQNTSSLGRKFNCSHVKVLEDLNLLNTPVNLITLKESIKNLQDVVFVSAATDDHLMYTMESFKTIRKYYPTHRYVFYGLNLNGPLQFQNDSNFEFRMFNTTPYPNYVNNFRRYHFKGLVLAEALRDFPVVFWIDAHQIIRKNGMLESLFRNISESRLEEGFSSITSFVPTPHSNFAVLHQDLLKFFPSNSMDLLKKEEQVGSGIIFVPRTKETMEVLKWWVLCSLTDECINPPGSKLACSFKEDQFNISANCFSPSVKISVLLLLLVVFSQLPVIVTFFSKILNNPGPFPPISDFYKNQDDIVFASITSDDHYSVHAESFATLRSYYPTHKYILYGLNMTQPYIDKLPKNDTNFEFHPFDTSRYPKYVETWLHYRFKSIILAEILRDYENVWYIDAHLEALKPEFIRTFFEEANSERLTEDFSPVISFISTWHSNFAVLHPGLLDYLPTNSIQLLKEIYQNFVTVTNPMEIVDRCNCTSAKTGKPYNFCYVNPQNSTLVGRKFSCELLEKLEDLDLLNDTPSSNSTPPPPPNPPKNSTQIAFISSTTDDQFDFSLSSFKCIREFYPDNKYLLYGLNLNSSFMNQLPNDDLNFEFRQLYSPGNHFKAVILAKALKDFPEIFWIDSDMAMRKPKVLEKIFEGMDKNNSGILAFRDTHYNVYSGVNTGSASFFPSNSIELLRNTSQVETSLLFLKRTKDVKSILKWWTLCTLSEDCIVRGTNSRSEQSVFNLLMVNQFQNNNYYFMDFLKSSFVTMKDLV